MLSVQFLHHRLSPCAPTPYVPILTPFLGSSLFPMEWSLGPFPGDPALNGAPVRGACPFPASEYHIRTQLGATNSPILWRPISSTLPLAVARAAPLPRRYLAVVPLIRDKRYYGEVTARLWRCQRAVGHSNPTITPQMEKTPSLLRPEVLYGEDTHIQGVSGMSPVNFNSLAHTARALILEFITPPPVLPSQAIRNPLTCTAAPDD